MTTKNKTSKKALLEPDCKTDVSRSAYHLDKILDDFEGEEWIDIVGYDGLYNVSNFGRVKSVERLVRNGKSERLVKERMLSQANTKDGRNSVMLSVNNKAKSFPINQLVYFSFHRNSFYKKGFDEITHIDKNPKNNMLSNLNLVSSKDSKAISIKHGKLNFKRMNEYNEKRKIEYQKLTHITCNYCNKKLSKENFEYGRKKCKECRNIARNQLNKSKKNQKIERA